ncbi:MAG: serine/threonine-protein kinase [Cyanobacteria bacterium P01_H01_bin.119]
MAPGIQAGMLIGSRYRLVKELGRGGFGHTYLAEDAYRFNEPCVLKAFVPQVEGAAALQKAQQLFEREAGVLYQLQHPQIPQFRELLRDQDRLFLVQDYVEGPTYLDLLNTRRGYGGCFTEMEIKQLFQRLLPVLDYIHGVGVVHRDISPDNIIQRNVDSLPMLIDFGGVKKLVANVNHQLTQTHPEIVQPALTRLGKVGYAPEEQLNAGEANPASDLYSLAVTALVLLSGMDPYDLYDRRNLSWSWRNHVSLSTRFGDVIDRMLAVRPSDRFPSARSVMQALGMAVSGIIPPPPPIYPPQNISQSPSQSSSPPTYGATVAANPASPPAPLRQTPSPPVSYPAASEAAQDDWESQEQPYPVTPIQRRSGGGYGFLQAMIGLILLIGAVGLVWWVSGQWQPGTLGDRTEDTTDNRDGVSAEEQARQQALSARREQLGISREFFVPLVDGIFYSRYPDLQGKTLTNNPEDNELRFRWDTIAAEMLDVLENNLSTAARQNLGRYGSSDRQQWQSRVNTLYVSSTALNDLADARFFDLFPEQATAEFIDQPIGQIWHGIAEDQVRAMEAGERRQELVFEADAFRTAVSDRLDPGQGMVYVLNLSEGQLMRLNLQAPTESTRLSIYLPRPSNETPFVLADSPDRTWSGRLTQSGYYEVVVVSVANQAIAYNLSVAVDNVISDPDPAETPEPEEKEIENP